MRAPCSADLRWRVIWFAHILQNSVAEASFFLGVCGTQPVGRSNGSISLSPREELIVFAYQIWKPQFLSVVQFPFDNCHSPFCPTTCFEIGVYNISLSHRKLERRETFMQVEECLPGAAEA